jgi:hypothetical protein
MPPNPSADIMPGRWTTPPLVRSDDKTEFDRLRETFIGDVAPRGAMEEMYVSDMASIVWEMLRLRRCRAVAVNTAFRDAVATVAERMMDYSGEPATAGRRQKALDLARRWFNDGHAKHEVLTLLGRYDLDETAIEAEAMRLSRYYLDEIEKRQAALEARRDKAISCIAACRANFAREVRASAKRIVDGAAGDRTVVDDDQRRLQQVGELLRRSTQHERDTE